MSTESRVRDTGNKGNAPNLPRDLSRNWRYFQKVKVVSYYSTYKNKTYVTPLDLADYVEVGGIKLPQTVRYDGPIAPCVWPSLSSSSGIRCRIYQRASNLPCY